MTSKLDIAREVAAKYLKGIVESDKYALHVARGIVSMVEQRLSQTDRLAHLEAVAEEMGEAIKKHNITRANHLSLDSAHAAYEAYKKEEIE